MKTIQALVLSIIHSFFAEVLLVLLNFVTTLDPLQALSSTSYILFVNTIWSLMFLLTIGGGRRTSVKVFIAPMFSSLFTVFTLYLIEGMFLDPLVLYLLLVVAGVIAVAVLWAYVASYGGE